MLSNALFPTWSPVKCLCYFSKCNDEPEGQNTTRQNDLSLGTYKINTYRKLKEEQELLTAVSHAKRDKEKLAYLKLQKMTAGCSFLTSLIYLRSHGHLQPQPRCSIVQIHHRTAHSGSRQLGPAEFPMTRSSVTRVSALLARFSVITQTTFGGNADCKCSTLQAETRCLKKKKVGCVVRWSETRRLFHLKDEVRLFLYKGRQEEFLCVR